MMRIIGSCFGEGAGNAGTKEGPKALHLPYEKTFLETEIFPSRKKSVLTHVRSLADEVEKTLQKGDFPFIIGGDHSIAMGSWQGATRFYGEMGLLWIDAHLDGHTFHTTHSGNIHGMSLAALLGEGDPRFTHLGPGFSPENVIVIGARCFEKEELHLLQTLGVEIHFIEEVLEKGFDPIFSSAMEKLIQRVGTFGISLDVDSFDPSVAPGTGTAVPCGLPASALNAFQKVDLQYCKVFEVVEFNPSLDEDDRTKHLIQRLLADYGAKVTNLSCSSRTNGMEPHRATHEFH